MIMKLKKWKLFIKKFMKELELIQIELKKKEYIKNMKLLKHNL